MPVNTPPPAPTDYVSMRLGPTAIVVARGPRIVGHCKLVHGEWQGYLGRAKPDLCALAASPLTCIERVIRAHIGPEGVATWGHREERS